MSSEGDGADAPLLSGPLSSVFAGPGLEPSPLHAAFTERDPTTRWQLQGELGAGGMGRVFLAWDSWLQREVAIKEPVGDFAVQEFSREVMTTAGLEHPGIVTIHDVVTSPAGAPWFVMPVVRGRSLAAHVRDAGTLAERLRLLRPVLAVCETIAYAHAQGFVHRDLKPANLMLGHFGQTQVIDWGFAARVQQPDRISGGGTPPYMSREQANGGPPAPADDVFSLGCIVFETVTGQVLRDSVQDLDGARTTPPPPLHELRRRAGGVPPELISIVHRATHRDPSARYADASAMAEDLRNHLDGLPVQAHAYRVSERLGRLARRWRAPLLVGTLALILLLILAAVALVRISSARDDAERNLALALTRSADEALRSEDRREARALIDRVLAQSPSPEALGMRLTLPPVAPQPIGSHPLSQSCAELIAVTRDGRGHLCRTGEETEVALARDGQERWRRPLDSSRGAIFLDEDRAVLVNGALGLTLLDASSGRELSSVRGGCSNNLRPTPHGRSALMHRPHCVSRVEGGEVHPVPTGACPKGRTTAVALRRDGRRAALACESGELVTLDSDGADPKMVAAALGPPGLGVSALAFIDDSDTLLVGTQQGWLLKVDMDTGQRLQMLAVGGYVQGIDVSPDGRRAIVDQHISAPLILDVRGFGALGRLPPGARLTRWASEASLVVAGEAVEVQDWASVRPRAVSFSHGVTALALAPDAAWLAVAQDQWLSSVVMAEREPVARTRWQDEVVKGVAFRRDGALLSHALGLEGSVVFRGPNLLREEDLVPHLRSRRVVPLAGEHLLVSSWLESHGTHLMRGEEILARRLSPYTQDLVGTRDGREAAGITTDGQVWRGTDLHSGGAWERCGRVEGGIAIALRERNGGSDVLVMGPAEALGGGGSDGERYVIDRAHGQPPLTAVAASEHHVIAGGRDGNVWVWRRGEPAPSAHYRAHDGRVSAIALEPAGGGFVTGSWDTRVVFWDLRELSDPHP